MFRDDRPIRRKRYRTEEVSTRGDRITRENYKRQRLDALRGYVGIGDIYGIGDEGYISSNDSVSDIIRGHNRNDDALDEGYASGLGVENQANLSQRRLKKPRRMKRIIPGKAGKALEQVRADNERQLKKTEAKKLALEQFKQEVSSGIKNQSVTIGDDYTYERTSRAYIHGLGTYTTEITIKVKKGNGPPLETTEIYNLGESVNAQLCSAKIDGFIQNNRNALAEEKQKIEKEMAPEYAALNTKSDPAAARTELDNKRDEKIAEAEEKANEDLQNFLDKYGNRRIDSRLLNELQWVEGPEASAREFKRKIDSAKKKLEKVPEELQKITEEINEKIQEIKNTIPSPAESHGLAGPSNVSSPDALTWENFEQKIKDFMHIQSDSELFDPIHEKIRSLATDESKYPEEMGSEDKLKIKKALLYIGLKFGERHEKLNAPLQLLAKLSRYTADYAGKRYLNESHQMFNQMKTIVEAAGEHANALYEESEWNKRVDQIYKEATGRAASSQAGSSAENVSLNEALEEQRQAQLRAAQTKAKFEEAKEAANRIQKEIEQAKSRDDSNDKLDEHNVNAIKETDKIIFQHGIDQQKEAIKHFFTVRQKNYEAIIEEEKEIRQLLMKWHQAEVLYRIQQQRLKHMYLLALFGAGDQAALTTLGRESMGEYNAFMALFR